MTVGDLEFSFTGDVSDLESSVDDAIEKVQDLADTVDRLDGKDIDIDADLNGASEAIRDAEEAADDLTSAVQNADGEDVTIDVADGELSTLQRRVQALDGRSIELETDVDRSALSRLAGPPTIDAPDADGTSRRSTFRLPGELDEVREVIVSFNTLSTQTKALVGSAVTATAALGAAGGLAAAATAVANEFGDLDIQRELQQTKFQFQSVANTFSDAFEPVLRQQLIPAAETLSDKLVQASDDVASFSATTFTFLKNAAEQDPSTTGGTASLIGEFIVNPLGSLGQAAESATGFRPSFPTGRNRGGGGGPSGIPTPDAAQSVQGGIGPIRRQLKKAQRRAEILLQIGAERAEVLKKRVSFLEDARKKALKVAAQFEKGSAAAKLTTQFVENLQARLEDARQKAEALKASLKGVAEQPADASQVEAAGPERLPTGGIGENIPDRVSGPSRAAAGVQRAKEQVVAFRFQLQRALQSLNGLRQFGAQAFLQVGRSVGRTIGRVVTLQTEVSSLGQAFKRVGQSIVGVIQSVITKLVSAIAAAAALAALTGGTSLSIGGLSGFSDFGKILGGVLGFAKGGVVQGATLGVVGEGTEDEAVMPLSRLSGFVEQAAQVGAASLTPSVPTPGNRFAGASVQAGSGGARLAGGTIEVPVEVLSQGTDEGDRKRSRTGRRV